MPASADRSSTSDVQRTQGLLALEACKGSLKESNVVRAWREVEQKLGCNNHPSDRAIAGAGALLSAPCFLVWISWLLYLEHDVVRSPSQAPLRMEAVEAMSFLDLK